MGGSVSWGEVKMGQMALTEAARIQAFTATYMARVS
jgi:hypothetical protein